MIGVVYLGNNSKTQERLRYIPGQLVRMTNAYKDAAQVCTPHVSNEHFIVFFERNVRSEDITAITYLRKKCRNVYIILLTDDMSVEERKEFDSAIVQSDVELCTDESGKTHSLPLNH